VLLVRKKAKPASSNGAPKINTVICGNYKNENLKNHAAVVSEVLLLSPAIS
jgi:S-ribosylhomocysteine lyase LuxS involved in autoinducer biosynthesis